MDLAPSNLAARSLSALHGYDRRLWILCAGFVISSMGFAMIVPFVSLYFHEELGVPMSVVGIFFLITAVIRSAFQGYAGNLSDHVGRRHLMVRGQTARAVTFALMAVAVHWRFGFLAAAGILTLSYVAGSFFQPTAQAAVADVVPAERRISAYALVRVAHNLGWGIGPMLGGMVSEAGYAWLFVLGALTTGASAWLVGRFFRESWSPSPAVAAAGPERPSGPRWHDFLAVRRDRRFVLFLGLTLLVFLAMSQWLAMLPVFASETLGVSRSRLGLVFGLNGFMVVAFQLPVTRALRKWRLVDAVILGAFVYAVAFQSLAFAASYAAILAGMAAITTAELIATPPLTALVSLLAPEGRMGRYMGAYSLLASFSWSVGPFVGGLLLDLWIDRPGLLWFPVAMLALAAALGFLRNRGRFPVG
jgi:MFS family permease